MTQHRNSTSRQAGVPLVNKEKDGTRNDVACEYIASIVPYGMNAPRPGTIMLQYCQNPACSKVERLLLAYPTGVALDTKEVRQAHVLAKALGVGVTILQHAPRDAFLKQPVKQHRHDFAVDGTLVASSAMMTWNGENSVINTMWADHKAHVAASPDPICGPNQYRTLPSGERILTYVDALNEVAYTQGKGNNDLTLSNAVRAVPGVRNIDLDQILTCAGCGQVEMVIETSSDGAPDSRHTRNPKSARMTNKVANALGAHTMLLQHSPGRDCTRQRIKVTQWTPRSRYNSPALAQIMQWRGFQDIIGSVHAEHYRTCPAK